MPIYKEEVLGRYLSVIFEVNDSLEPYSGQITKYKYEVSLLLQPTITDGDDDDDDGDSEEEGNRRMLHRHYIVFEDGEELWLDLVNLRRNGRLKWLRGRSTAAASAAVEGTAARKGGRNKQEEIDPLTAGKNKEKNFNVDHKRPAAVVPKTPPKSKKKKTNAVITPPSKPFQASKDDPLWIQNMTEWLQETPHGPGLKTVSPTNAAAVIRKVRKLASGEGVSYPAKWPADIVFGKDRTIDIMTSDFDSMLQEAKNYEEKYGKDTGHGWLLQHPIKKLKLYQEYIIHDNNNIDMD